jgi:hypothetical protein
LKIAQFALLTLASLPLFAQRYEVGAFYSYERTSHKPLGTVRDVGGADTDTRLRNGQGYGLRLTYNTKGYYGHEVHYQRNLIPLESNVDAFLFNPDGTITIGGAVDRHEKLRQSELGYNFLMYMMPLGEWWRPFITVGAATVKTNAPLFPEWTAAGTRNFSGNFGGGIKLYPMKHFVFRLDARGYLTGRPFVLNFPSGSTSQGALKGMQFSAGFSYAFGK